MTDIIKPAKLNIILDASKIDLFETCPCRYDYRHNQNKGLPLAEKAPALDLGGLAHKGLEQYFLALADGQQYSERMDKCLMKIREISSNPDSSNLDPDDVKILLNAVEESCDFWRAEDENCIEVLAVEQPFAYQIYEDDIIRFIISGQIDLLCNFRGVGGNASYVGLPIDHKTFSRESMLLRKSNQFINYSNAVESEYLTVNRIGLHDPEVKKPKQPEEKYKRLTLSYDKEYIQDWKDNLVKMLMMEFIPCVTENYWPEKPTSCNKFNRLCEYYPICDSSGRAAKLFKLSEYVDVDPWDVTRGLNE